MKKFIKKNIISKNYWLAKKLRTMKFKIDLENKVILVYSMGKVGSDSFYTSLKNNVLPVHTDLNVYFIHYLNDNNLLKAERFERNSYPKTKQINRYLIEGRYLKKQIDKGYDYKRNFKIITGIRDIVAADMSNFFQNLYRNHHYNFAMNRNGNIDSVIDDLIELYLKTLGEYRWRNWFNTELKSVMKLDVFTTNFPKSKGYKIYKGDHPETLLYRLENLNENATTSIKEFLGIDGFKLIRSNFGEDKSYSEFYKKFKSRIVLPKKYIENVYTSEMMRHFYTDSELENFMKKWKTI